MGGGGIPRARSHPDRLRGESGRVRDEFSRASTEKRRAQFLAIVSHEMRTPLTSIISFSELVRGEADGLSPDGLLVEFVELPRSVHPFFVATQAHPEFLSRPTRPHPLFSGLVAAALERSRAVPTAADPLTVAGRRAAASA